MVVLPDAQIRNGGGEPVTKGSRNAQTREGGALQLETAQRKPPGTPWPRCHQCATPTWEGCPGREPRTFDGDALPPVTPTHGQSWKRAAPESGVQCWAVGCSAGRWGAGPGSGVQGQKVGCSSGQ